MQPYPPFRPVPAPASCRSRPGSRACLPETSNLHSEEEARLNVLEQWWKIRRHNVSAATAAGIVRVSPRTLFRWQSLHRQGQLRPKSRRPRRLRRPAWSHELKQAILELRSTPMQLTWGPAKIVVKLRERGFQTSEATVGRILITLKKQKDLPPQARKSKSRRLAAERPHAHRRQKGSRPFLPGERVQVDTLYLQNVFGRWICQMTVYDPVSKRVAAEIVPSLRSMRIAFERVPETFPVVIRGGQVDNGSEFRGEFETRLQERGIAMQLIQPRSPEQNGCVERCQRTFRRELYETSSVAVTPDEYRQDARRFADHHNQVRPHAALGGWTPIGYLQKHHGGSLRRNLTAKGSVERPASARSTGSAICRECVHGLDFWPKGLY